ncbi:sensor histidine kinase [Jatrophihabitans sp. YIM 134969]
MTAPPVPGVRLVLPRAWVPDVVTAALLGVVGLVEVAARSMPASALLVVLGSVGAVVLARHANAYALGVVWASAAIQVLSRNDVIVVEVVAAMIVAYATAQHGSRALLWVSGLSIPAGATLAMTWLVWNGSSIAYALTDRTGALSYAGSAPGLVTAGWLLVAGLLGVPWVAGLAVRARSQADRSRVQQLAAEEERDRAEVGRAAAEEIASLRAEQARLARDVHDVVGHSLAVILVQAESASFLPDDDLERIRLTMTNIATSARRSLQDVRAVLSSTGDPEQTGVRAPDVAELVTDLREAGNDVRAEVVGEPWPLTPAEQTLVFRLAQEMLTNALKHGVRGEPVFVEQRWSGDLLLEVRNRVDASRPAREGGLGIVGMQRRVEEVGGRLAVRRRESEHGDGSGDYAATALIPTSWTGG